MFRSMFHEARRAPLLKTAVLGVTLLTYPSVMLAQHGGGGGGRAPGGGAGATGGAMGSAGRATGVSVKDDLKDFHAVLAAQATSQQIIAYTAMLKTTTAASTEFDGFLELLGKENRSSELAGRGAILDQAIEKARSENKKFLDGLSEQQKSSLKEITKKLIKSDADLGLQARALGQEVGDAKGVGQPIANWAQGLERALTSFRNQQLYLGEEMSIGAASNGKDSAFNLPPVKSSVSFANQPIAIYTSGAISRGVAEGAQNIFKLELTADLSDLQQNITEVLRAQLNKASRCGERIAILSATLNARAPASLVVARLHFERWACATMFGRETVNEVVEGNPTIEVKLTPVVGKDGTLQMRPEIGRVDAEGLIGELLRSGSVGDGLRDTIAELLLSAVRQGGDFKLTLPPVAQDYAVLHHAQFQDTGSGRLLVELDGEIRVSNEKASVLSSELEGRSSSRESVQETPR
jgi:hypothetical protein